MSDQDQGKRAPPKNLYGAKKIEAFGAEKASRRDEHEEDYLRHDRNTVLSRQNWKHIEQRTERYQKFQKEAEVRLAGLPAEEEALREKIQHWKEELEKLKEKSRDKAQSGEDDTKLSAKYKAYLEMESDELDLD